MAYIAHLLNMTAIYVILGISLNLLFGYAELFSVCHAIFYGIGAYAVALLTLKLGMNFIVAAIAAIALASIMGAIISIPSIRVKAEYLMLVTFGFQMVMYTVFVLWVSLTRGPSGIPGIPRLSFFGYTFFSRYSFLPFSWSFAALSFFVAWRVVNSPFGRVLRANREDELATQALGKNVRRFKVQVFVLSSAMAALGGCLLAPYITFVGPEYFTLHTSITLILLVILGGLGNLWGSVVGAVIVVLLPEILRFVALPAAIANPLRMVLYSGLLVLCLMFRPQGIIPERPTREERIDSSHISSKVKELQ